MEKRKKKGRPSLLDLQKRSLKQHHSPSTDNSNIQFHKTPKFQNPTHSSRLRSARRSPNRNPNSNPTSEDDENPSTRQKKLKHVLKSAVIDSGEANSGSDDPGSSGSNPKKRKVHPIEHGSELNGVIKVEKHSAATNQTSSQQGSKLDNGPSTPLPDKKLLLFILDRLQKKDTYGVFADPVDPEELPDYFEIVTDPMDFSTVRKKLGDGAYSSLERFEKDIYLICSNAMQYNSSDTVFFRQARAIQELAKKNFDNLRQDSDDNEPERDPEPEPEPRVVRRGRPPKNLKRPPGRPPLERTKSPLERASSGPSQATLATPNRSNNNDMRKASPLVEKYGSPDLSARSSYGLRLGEAYTGWSAERYQRTDDLTGSTSKGIMMKHGKKNMTLDDNRRNTYLQSCTLASVQEPTVLTTFYGERKQLIPVGLQSEYGYARSLARFTAKLGPVAWKVASGKIQRCLPAGIKFGVGWVGESEAPSSLLEDRVGSNQSAQKHEERLSPIQQKLDNGSSPVLSPSADKNGDNQPRRINGLNNGSPRLHFASKEVKMAENSNHVKHSDGVPNARISEKGCPEPPDLNVGFRSPGSPCSGKIELVHPDLALQL